jgi:hypothetical protein
LTLARGSITLDLSIAVSMHASCHAPAASAVTLSDVAAALTSTSAASSAYSSELSSAPSAPPIAAIPPGGRCFLMMIASAMMQHSGENRSPCGTPRLTSNGSLSRVSPLADRTLTHAVALLQISRKIALHFGLAPASSSDWSRKKCETVSKAAEESIKVTPQLDSASAFVFLPSHRICDGMFHIHE